MTTWKYAKISSYQTHHRIWFYCTDALVMQQLSQALLAMDPGIKNETSKTKGKTASERYRDSHFVQFGNCDAFSVVTWLIEQLGAQGWEPFAETVDREGVDTISLRCRVG